MCSTPPRLVKLQLEIPAITHTHHHIMSNLLQTAMANASLQSGHPVSPSRSDKRLSSSDRGRMRSSASTASKTMTDEEDEEDHPGYSDDDSDDDEIVELATRPTTPVPSQSRERDGQDSSEKAGRFVATRDPVSLEASSGDLLLD